MTFLNFFPSFSVCVPCVFAAKFVIFTVFECVDLDPTAGTGRVDGSDGRCGCLQVVSCGTVQMEINNFGSVSVKQSMLTCTGEALAAMLVSALVNTKVLVQAPVSHVSLALDFSKF